MPDINNGKKGYAIHGFSQKYRNKSKLPFSLIHDAEQFVAPDLPSQGCRIYRYRKNRNPARQGSGRQVNSAFGSKGNLFLTEII